LPVVAKRFAYFSSTSIHNFNLKCPENLFLKKKCGSWVRFQEAVKFNQKLAESILAPLITNLELPVKLW
jgi:hypothetical protein